MYRHPVCPLACRTQCSLTTRHGARAMTREPYASPFCRTVACSVVGTPICSVPALPLSGSLGTDTEPSRITGTSGVLTMSLSALRICRK